VLIKFTENVRDYDLTTVYKVNGNGEISFFEWTEIYLDYFYRIRVNEEGEMVYVGNIGPWRNLD
jgi:hypothetical protein